MLDNKKVSDKVRIKEDVLFDCFFNGTLGCEQIKDVTRGKVYEVVEVKDTNNIKDLTIIDDKGKKRVLADFLVDEV